MRPTCFVIDSTSPTGGLSRAPGVRCRSPQKWASPAQIQPLMGGSLPRVASPKRFRRGESGSPKTCSVFGVPQHQRVYARLDALCLAPTSGGEGRSSEHEVGRCPAWIKLTAIFNSLADSACARPRMCSASKNRRPRKAQPCIAGTNGSCSH